MNAITPFSGLSLIVHLIIIGVANLSAFFFKKEKTNKLAKPKVLRFPVFVKTAERFASIMILIMVTGFITFSTALALQTGIREGQDELHRKYAGHMVANLPNLMDRMKQLAITKIVYGDTEHYYKVAK